MSDIKNVVFRSSISGYNKSDVNEYLVRMSQEFNEREAAVRERAERAEKEAQASEEKLAELEGCTENYKIQIAEITARLDNALGEKLELENKAARADKETVSEYEARIKEQDAVIARQFEEIDSLREELENTREKLAGLDSTNEKYEELSRKAQLYEKTSANIGDAIISANKTAEEIVAAAKEEARLLAEQAQRELDEKRRALEESARRALESIFGKLASAASENRKEVAGASAYAYQIIDKALADIKNRNDSVNTRLKNYEDNLWKSIKDDLDAVGTEKNDIKRPIHKKPSAEQLTRFKK